MVGALKDAWDEGRLLQRYTTTPVGALGNTRARCHCLRMNDVIRRSQSRIPPKADQLAFCCRVAFPAQQPFNGEALGEEHSTATIVRAVETQLVQLASWRSWHREHRLYKSLTEEVSL